MFSGTNGSSDVNYSCCPTDGTALERIGEESCEQVEFIPAQLRVLRHVRPKYACPQCRTGVHTKPMPPQPIPKSLASPALLAHVAISKYADGLPLYRQDRPRVDAPLEWLAFRGLPLLPSFPRGTRIVTTGVVGRGDDMTFTWPLWTVPATRHTTRSVLQVDWTGNAKEHRARGVFAICSSKIWRTSQGFGNFRPSSVMS